MVWLDTIFRIVFTITLYEISKNAAFYIQKRIKKKVKPVKHPKIIPFMNKLYNIDDPKKLEEALDRLTREQFEQYGINLERRNHTLSSFNLGTYLEEKINGMKVGDYRIPFILDIVNYFNLHNQFGNRRK